MPPNSSAVIDSSNVVGEKKPALNHPALDLSKIRKAIPKEAFVKSISRSLFHMFFDYAMIFGSLYALVQFNTSEYYATAPEWQKWAATLAYWNVAGFFMWGIFVVGHDCGHGTFSEYTLFNDIVGHICHGSIMVPYYPWALSHRRHHMYHNHVDKDYSHPWYVLYLYNYYASNSVYINTVSALRSFEQYPYLPISFSPIFTLLCTFRYTPEKLKEPEYGLARTMEKNGWLRFFFPFFGWAVYLFGLPDGSHFFPWALSGEGDNRLWKESYENTKDYSEHTKCLISSTVVFANAYAILHVCQWNWETFAYYYLAPALVYGWWLVTVTYLQHHDHSTEVFGEDEWNFVYSAFQTIDRKVRPFRPIFTPLSNSYCCTTTRIIN